MADTDTLEMPEEVVVFLQDSSIVTIATSINNQPHCAACYYAYVPEEQLLAFKSDNDTKHIEDALSNNIVAGSILPDKVLKSKPKGIQFTGEFFKAENEIGDMAKSAYLKKFPVSAIFRGDIWVIALSNLKFTDNTPLFGKKILWER